MTKNTYVLITGSSAGIGLELAHQFASKGYNIVLTARREERLIKLSDDLMQQYGVDAKFISADLADVAKSLAILKCAFYSPIYQAIAPPFPTASHH